MSRKSMVLAALMFVVDFFSALFKELKKRGVTEEGIFDAMKSRDDLIPKMAEAIAALVAKTKRVSVHLKIAAENIAVATAAFSRDDFFASKLGVKMYCWDNFTAWVTAKVLSTVPAFTGKLTSYTLSKNMYDAEIRAEIGEDQVFTPDEFTAIIRAMTAKQANGEAGDLLTNGSAGIFYVRLDKNTVVAVCAYWFAADRGWYLDARRLDDGYWRAGYRVFSRS